MRKLLLILGIILFLIGCSDESETEQAEENSEVNLPVEVEKFINVYNQEVENIEGYEQELPELEKIKQSEIEDPIEESGELNQSLLKFMFEEDGFYEVFSVYDLSEELLGYRMITEGQPTNDNVYLALDDRSLMLGAVIADSLGLGIDEYYDNIRYLLSENKESGSYSESGYFVEFDLTPEERLLTVNYTKEETELQPKEEKSEVETEGFPEEDKTETKESDETEDIEEVEEEEAEPVDQTQDNKDSIESAVNNVVRADLDNTTITDLRVNQDVSVDEERYIVLVDLEWDVKNGADTTKEMLDMYSDHLAASLANDELIYELVMFWTVPYHNKNDSILKKTYENEGGGMFLTDEVVDVNVFN
jgi:hypothetical protein